MPGVSLRLFLLLSLPAGAGFQRREMAKDKFPCVRETTIWRPKWFLLTRFFAVIGVTLTLILSQFLFHVETLQYADLWKLDLILLLSNLAYLAYYRIYIKNSLCDDQTADHSLSRFIVVQINADLIILTFMLHFSGGATNPFTLYYFFHTILSSILLSKRGAYIEAGVASGLFVGMTVLEGMGTIPHYNLFMPRYFLEPSFMVAMSFAVTSALFIAVYMATSIMDRLRAHQEDLEHTLAEIRRLEEEKSRFLDVVAHDLKGPLAAIETMVTSTLMVHGDTMKPEVKQMLERIPRRTRDLGKFTGELLEFSRLRKLGKVTREYRPLNFLPIVSATVEMYIQQAIDKDIKVAVQASPNLPMIQGDKEQLERMAGNLVSNAIRYTPDGGSVTVKLAHEGNALVLTVADTGIGIPEAALPRIFNEFYRADNARKFSTAGTGLGMSITRAIVEQHGGTIEVRSHEGEGTAFTVRLPVG